MELATNTDLQDLPWDRPDPFAIAIAVQQVHIDALGHTNNVHYLEWLQQCAWQHSLSRGFGEEQMVALGKAMAVRTTHMDYLGATFKGDTLVVGDWITACDRRLRATRSFQIIRRSDQACVMRAQIDYVCIDIASGKPSRMPPVFKSAYGDDLRD
ncbi:MAG: acyl-CoA thioesterase [Pseudomonadales bacterium]